MPDISSPELKLNIPPLSGMSQDAKNKVAAMKDQLSMEVTRRLSEILPSGNSALRAQAEKLLKSVGNKERVLNNLDPKINPIMGELYNRPGVTLTEQVLYATEDGSSYMGCVFECPETDDLPAVKRLGFAYPTPISVQSSRVRTLVDVSDIAGMPHGAVVAIRTGI